MAVKQMMCVDDFKKNLCHYCNTYMSEEPCEHSECWVHDVIAQTGTVDAVPVVHGHWISLDECSNAGVYCSVCHKKVWKEDYAWCNRKNKLRSNYCPNCGADMRERSAGE